jgi:fructokinase
MTRLAGVELGGTNANLVLGTPAEVVKRARLDVTDGKDTLDRIAGQLRQWHEQAPIEALGIASFGPLQLDSGQADYGHIISTVKPGWDGADVLGTLQGALGCPAKIHTDVTGAALAEGVFGAAMGCRDFVYVTVGTGIGMGIIVAGQPVVAALHPEAGHLRVRRMEGDAFGGVCSYHEDCMEGLASGPAIAARARKKGENVKDDDPIWQPVIDALAEGCSTLFLTLATERIVLGGGVINQHHWLVQEIAFQTATKLCGYLPYIGQRAPIIAAGLGTQAGQRGALLLAQQALQSRA